MKKVFGVLALIMLVGCGPPVEVQGYWIRLAEKVCEDNDGLYSIYYSDNAMYKTSARCNDSSIKQISK